MGKLDETMKRQVWLHFWCECVTIKLRDSGFVEETKLKTGKPKITNRKQNARACMHVAVC